MLREAEERGRVKGLREAGSKIAENTKGLIATIPVEEVRRLKRALQHKAPERQNEVTTADSKQGRKLRARRVYKGTGGDFQKTLNPDRAYAAMKAEDASDLATVVYLDDAGHEEAFHKRWGYKLAAGMQQILAGQLDDLPLPKGPGGVRELDAAAVTWEDDGAGNNPVRHHRLWVVGIDDTEETLGQIDLCTADCEKATATVVHTINSGKPSAEVYKRLRHNTICERIAARVCPIVVDGVRVRVNVNQCVNDELEQQHRGAICGGNSHCRCMLCTGDIAAHGLGTEGSPRRLVGQTADGRPYELGGGAFNLYHLHKTLLRGDGDQLKALSADREKAADQLGVKRKALDNFGFGIKGTPQDYLVRIILVGTFQETSIYKGGFHCGRAHVPAAPSGSPRAEELAGIRLPTPLPHEEEDVIVLYLTRDMAEAWLDIRDGTVYVPGKLHFAKGAIKEVLNYIEEHCLTTTRGHRTKQQATTAFNALVNDITGREDRNALKAKDYVRIAYALPTHAPKKQDALPLSELCSPDVVMAATLLRDVVIAVQNPTRCYTECDDLTLDWFSDLDVDARVNFFTAHAAWTILVNCLLIMAVLPIDVKLHFHIMAIHFALDVLLRGKAGISEQLAEGSFLYYNQRLTHCVRKCDRLLKKRLYDSHGRAYLDRTGKYKAGPRAQRHSETRKDQATAAKVHPPLAALPAKLLRETRLGLGDRLTDRVRRLREQVGHHGAEVVMKDVGGEAFLVLVPHGCGEAELEAVMTTLRNAWRLGDTRTTAGPRSASVEQRLAFVCRLARHPELLLEREGPVAKRKRKARKGTGKKAKP